MNSNKFFIYSVRNSLKNDITAKLWVLSLKHGNKRIKKIK